MPDLSWHIRSVRPEHRQECAHLEPADIQFLIPGIIQSLLKITVPEPLGRGIAAAAAAACLPVLLYDEEAADVQRPPGHAAQCHIQPFGDLDPQCLPGGGSVTGPGHHTVFLDTGIGGAGQVQHAPVRICLPLVFKHALGVEFCEEVRLLWAKIFLMFFAHQPESFPGFPHCLTAPVRSRERFRGIAPPAVKPVMIQPLIGLLPVKVPGRTVKCVVGRQIIQKMAGIRHLLIVDRIVIHIRPDGDHGVDMHPMQFLPHLFQIREALTVDRELLSPAVTHPGLPVLHHTVQTDTAAAVFAGDLHQFLLRLIPFPGLHISESPFGKERRFSGQVPVSADQFIRVICADHVVIQLIHRFQKQVGAPLVIVECHHTAAVRKNGISPVGEQPGHGDPHVVLVQILGFSPVIENAFLTLSQSVNLLPFLPFKPQFRPAGCPDIDGAEIFHNRTVSVHSPHPVTDRFLPACAPLLQRHLCQLLISFLK